MKLLIPIDQAGSIAAGYEAPHSTTLVDYPVRAMPEPVRRTIAALWDAKTGIIEGAPQLALPVTERRIEAWLQAIHEARKAGG